MVENVQHLETEKKQENEKNVKEILIFATFPHMMCDTKSIPFNCRKIQKNTIPETIYSMSVSKTKYAPGNKFREQWV